MNRPLSHLGPALILAVVTLAATAVAVAAPPPMAFVGPLLLVLTLVGADLTAPRSAGRALQLSPGVIVVAGAIILGAAVVGASSTHLASMMPIFGGCASVALVTRDAGERPTCRHGADGAGGGLA